MRSAPNSGEYATEGWTKAIWRTHEPFSPHLAHYRSERKIMRMLNRRAWRTLAAFVILPSSLATAQPVSNSFEALSKLLKTGQIVVVTDATGQQTKGVVADLSPSSLVVSAPEARTFAESTVIEIRGPDTLRSGALTGLGFGAGAGYAMVMAMCADGPDCGPVVHVIGISAGIGAAIGAGIDALMKNRGRVLYRSRQQTLSLTISPLAGRDRQGVLASVRF